MASLTRLIRRTTSKAPTGPPHQRQGQGVRALLVENITDPRLVKRIAQEAGARVGGTRHESDIRFDLDRRVFEQSCNDLEMAFRRQSQAMQAIGKPDRSAIA